MNDFNRQRRTMILKKHKQRNKDRNKMSIFFVVMFMVVFFFILATEMFFINEQRGGAFIPGKQPEYDPLLDVSDYMMPEKKLGGNVPIGSSSRIEVLPKNEITKGPNSKYIDGTHVTTKVSENIKKIITSRAKKEWMSVMDDVHYLDEQSPATDATWKPVYNLKHKFYVYSAYYDNRKGQGIKVVGATQTKKSERAWCRFWYSDSTSAVVDGVVKNIRENWNLKYSACFILCPLTLLKHKEKRSLPIPISVSILADPVGNATNKILIKNLENDQVNPPNKFAVCVKPIHFHYNRIHEIVEFIELNRIIGVEHFTFYVDTIGDDVGCILKEYERLGLVEILPWQLNIESQKEIRTEGMFAALNDCLYRNMYRYKYILMIDIDEYIVPHHNQTLHELMEHHRPKFEKTKVGALSFKNCFFYRQWPDDPNSASLPPLITLQKTRRKQKFHNHRQRSKYIVMNPNVMETGNHFVWEYATGYTVLNVDPKVAFLHHYRICEFGGDDCVRNPHVTDTTMYRYKDKLVQNFNAKLKDFSELCHIDLSKRNSNKWSSS